MKFINIIKDYISEHKALFYSFIVLCCISYIIRVLVMSRAYGELFNKKANIPNVIKIICAIWVSISVLYVFKSRIEMILIPDFLSYVRHRVFTFYLEANEYNYNDTTISADVSRLLDITRSLRDLFYWLSHTLFPIIIMIIVMNLYFFYIFPRIGVVNVLGNLLMFYVSSKQYDRMIESSIKKETQFLKIADKIDENFNNMMNIFLNDKVNDTLEENKTIDDEYKRLYVNQSREMEKFVTYLKAISYCTAAIGLVLLYKYSKLDQFINVLLMYTFYISAFENMTEDIPYYLLLAGNIKHSEELLNKKAIPKPQYSKNLDNYKGNILFKNITFAYPIPTDYETDANYTVKNIVENFSLDIKKGDRVTLLAQSGSGKTTIMKLLLGFYKPQKGEILLDDINSNDIDPKDIRKHINYINQRTLLINDTIINNMKYGNKKTDKQIIDILKKYNLLSVFNSDPSEPEKCLYQVVLKNGSNMSMGMQKVIYLVRGLLKDDTSVYVLDEPLTSIDPGTRQNVLNFIEENVGDKTLIVISHDKEVAKIKNMKMLYLNSLQNKKEE
jgi:ATP-binding cassette subfamily C protein